ncbi:MAG: thioredoxin family protein [Labilibaculum sp.]|nr:thioredoxin family protein [Labilibaculum sp.]
MRKIAQLAFVFVCIIVISSTNTIAQSNLDEALQKAKMENKHVFLNFSGSDWCRSCILLKKTILDTEEFKKFADEKLVILDVDFPRLKKNKLSKEQTAINEALAARYNKKGQFPTVLLLDSNAKVLGKTAYKKISPEAYIKHIKSIIKE